MKIKMSKWSIAGILAGFVLTIFSAWRYFVLYRDIDKLIMYPLIGILIIAVSWLYNKSVEQGNRIEEMSEYLADKNLEELENNKQDLNLQRISLEQNLKEVEQKEVEDGD